MKIRQLSHVKMLKFADAHCTPPLQKTDCPACKPQTNQNILLSIKFLTKFHAGFLLRGEK